MFLLIAKGRGEIMGILEKITGGLGGNKNINLEEYMDAMEMEEVDALHEPADMYVKPIALEREEDLDVIMTELKNGNIVLLNVSRMIRWPNKLKNSVTTLKEFANKINGDIARIDEDKILLTPSKVKIIKKMKRRR